MKSKKKNQYKTERDPYTNKVSMIFSDDIRDKLNGLPPVLLNMWEEQISGTLLADEFDTSAIAFWRDMTYDLYTACRKILRITETFLDSVERPDNVWCVKPLRYDILDDNSERYFLFRENAEDYMFDHEGITRYDIEEVPYDPAMLLMEYTEEVCV